MSEITIRRLDRQRVPARFARAGFTLARSHKEALEAVAAAQGVPCAALLRRGVALLVLEESQKPRGGQDDRD